MTSTVTKGRIVRSDQQIYDGISETVNRKDSTGGTIVSLPIGDGVDVLGAYGDIDYNRRTIARCVDAIGSRTRTLVFRPGTWVIDDNLTIGSNFTCRILAGCVFQVAATKTLTFNGPVIRDATTWTSGSGTVTESGTRAFTGTNTFAGTESHSSTESHSGSETHTGSESHTGTTTFQNYINYAVLSGTNTYTGTLSPAITAYVTGAIYYLANTNANSSTTPTVALNSLAALTVVLADGTAVRSGDMPAGWRGIYQYDGTNLRLLNPAIGHWTTFTPTVTLVGGAGNTVPVYSTNSGRYTRIGNTVYGTVVLSGDGGAEGAGTGVINIALPVTASANALQIFQFMGRGLNNATEYQLLGIIDPSATTVNFRYYSSVTAISSFTGADQNNATRQISINFWYEV